LYYSTSATGTYPGYRVTPNTAYRITAAAGATVYYYYTYSVPEGGERNTSATKNNFVVGNCSSLKDAEQMDETTTEITAYPNPAVGEVTLTNVANMMVTVYNSAGQVVLNTYVTEDGKLNVGRLSTGVYYLRAGMQTIKLLRK
jgi:hypothetical protein